MKNMQTWFMKQPKWLQIVIGILVIVIIWVVVSKVIKALNKPKFAKVNQDNLPTVPNGSGGAIPWDPDPLARELYDKICNGYNVFTYPEVTDRINALPNDDAVRALYNHCINNYNFDPIRCLQSEWPDWGGSYARALSRIKSAVNG